MLYDFALDRLDPERKSAVEEFLKSDAESRLVLENIRLAIEYTEKLAGSRISGEALAPLKDSENAISLGRRYASWRAWPDTLRWTIGALVLSSLVATVIAVIPWHRLPNFNKSEKATDAAVIELAQIGNKAGEAHTHTEEGGSEPEDLNASNSVTGSEEEEIEGATAIVGVAQNQPQPTPKPAANQPAQSTNQEPEQRAAPAGKSFVYRAFMNLKDLDSIGSKIAAHITELGGQKAGEVELGWKRGSGRYFHFALPKVNEDKLLEQLRAYGPVRMSKDPHSRVMPEGQVRFILWVEPL
jgi:hypothetical protein